MGSSAEGSPAAVSCTAPHSESTAPDSPGPRSRKRVLKILELLQQFLNSGSQTVTIGENIGRYLGSPVLFGTYLWDSGWPYHLSCRREPCVCRVRQN